MSTTNFDAVLSDLSCDCRWEELMSLTKERDQKLKGAEQVHKFVRDASETNDRMNEKVS